MKIIARIIKSAIAITVILYGFYFAGSQGWLENTPFKDTDYEQFNFLQQENLEQTQVLTERAQETSGHIQKILGDKVEVDEGEKEKALHEKTAEYARYLYCKQVVEDWEKEL